MKLRIFAEDKPAEKVFEYQLELADRTILLSTALLSGAIALANIIVYISLSDLLLFMVFIKRKTIEKYKKISFLGQIWGESHDNNKQ